MHSRRICWVIDGTYQHELGDLVFGAADIIVSLDLPVRVWLTRLVRRTWRRARGREQLWNGNRESLASAIWGRDSLFVLAFGSHFRGRREWPHARRLPGHPVANAFEVRTFLLDPRLGSQEQPG